MYFRSFFTIIILILVYSNKLNGISFVIKANNEEKTIDSSIKSLYKLNIPYEINVILHRCTDNSTNIVNNLAKNNNKIRIFEYSHKISRPGYETLATDYESNHSLPKFYTWSISHSNYIWIAKWDADFVMTDELAYWINSQNIWNETNRIIKLGAKNFENNLTEISEYFSSSIVSYRKYVFYEAANQQIIPSTHVVHDLSNTNIYIHHNSSFDQIKNYWYEKPWYLTENSEEASIVKDRINKLNNDFGKELIGLARSGNHDATLVGQKIVDLYPDYINFFE